MTIFFKGVLKKDLCQNYVPGTVTLDFNEALMWKQRIESNKTKGAAKHVRHGQAVIIKIEFKTEDLLDCTEFQRSGVSEHNRNSCWLSAAKTKAQINTSVNFVILTDDEINQLYKP